MARKKAKPAQKAKQKKPSAKAAKAQKRARKKIILQSIRGKPSKPIPPKLESKLSKIMKGQAREEKEIRQLGAEQARMERGMRTLDQLAEREGILIKRIEAEERKIEGEERRIEGLLRREDRVLAKIEEKEEEISEAVMKIGSVVLTRTQFIDISRAAAGAFLAFGLSLRYFDVFAARITPVQFVGLLGFVLLGSGILLFLREREQVSRFGILHVVGRVAALYLISLFVEIVSFAIFGMIPVGNWPLLAEMLVVGSYVTMAGAVAFSLI